MCVGAVRIRVFSLEMQAVARKIERLIVACSPNLRWQPRVLLDFVVAVGSAGVLETFLSTSWTTARRCMDVVVSRENTTESPIATTGFERTRIQRGERRRLVCWWLGARNQRATLGALLGRRHWGLSVADTHVVANKHIFAFCRSPCFAFVSIIQISNTNAILRCQLVACITVDDKMRSTGVVCSWLRASALFRVHVTAVPPTLSSRKSCRQLCQNQFLHIAAQ